MPVSSADPPRVVLRADASPQMGLGHVTRSLALARRLADDGWSVWFLGSGVPAEVAHEAGIDVVEVAEGALGIPVPAGQSEAGSPDLVVVDGYHFGAEVFAELERASIPYAVIDDGGATLGRRPIAVVDQNPHADPAAYRHLEGSPRLLLGADHVLVRRSVAEAGRQPSDRTSGAVFVVFGGSDTRGLTVEVTSALAGEGWDVRAAVGPVHADRRAVVDALDAADGVTVIEPSAYVDELAAAHVAVVSVGTTMWEAAHLATPTVAIVVADNQRLPGAAALDDGLVRNVLEAGPDLVARLVPEVAAVLSEPAADNSQRLADGSGRVAAALLDSIAGGVRLRAADAPDARFLFELRTDPDVASWSFRPTPTWDEHVAWLDAVLPDPERRLFVVELGHVPIGQVRIDDLGAEREISVALVPSWRGRGLARPTIGAAVASVDDGCDVIARVRPGNSRSVASFAAVGFVCESTGADEIVMRRRAGVSAR